MKGDDIVVTRRLLLRIVTEIKTLMEEKELSSRELAEMCNEKGFEGVTRSKILRAFYTGENRQFFLNNTDDTIEAVLTTLGYTGEDILDRILQKDNEVNDVVERTPVEIINFVKDKKSIPYLKMAYAEYKLNGAREEYERLKKQIVSDVKTEPVEQNLNRGHGLKLRGFFFYFCEIFVPAGLTVKPSTEWHIVSGNAPKNTKKFFGQGRRNYVSDRNM